MIKSSVTIDETISFLNELLVIDRAAITDLVLGRVHCNEQLAHHPTVQVGLDDGNYSVGFLGVLNGLFGTNEVGWGEIVAAFSHEESEFEESTLLEFRRPLDGEGK